MSLGGPWRPDGLSKADFDPLWVGHWGPTLGHNGAVDRFMRRLSATGEGHGFAAWRYSRPVGPLYHKVIVPTCAGDREVEVPSAAGNVGFRPGQYVSVGQTRQGAVILGSPPTGLLGASGFALHEVDGGAFDEMAVVEVDPYDVPRGVTNYQLKLKGYGFQQSPLDSFVAAIYEGNEADPEFGQYEADPYVTLHTPTWVDIYTVNILANTSASTPDGYRVMVAWRRGSEA